MQSKTTSPLLQVEDLGAEFRTRAGTVQAVDGVSFSVEPGEVLAIVGESGSGKTATALSILGLLPHPSGRVTAGRVLLKGEDLLSVDAERLRQVRGDQISMVFQEPILNPVARVGHQIGAVLRAHRPISRADAAERAVELLDRVGIPRPRERATDYPHQFSGGMRQRAMIAMAIALEPEILIADEPTTALDVTIQAQVLELLAEVRTRLGMAMILITHDLGVVAGTAQRVMVMYGGRKVEEAPVRDLFQRPAHPYTRALLESTIRLDRPRTGRLAQVSGSPPTLIEPAPGCRFAARCPQVVDRCRTEDPVLRTAGPAQTAACHLVPGPSA